MEQEKTRSMEEDSPINERKKEGKRWDILWTYMKALTQVRLLIGWCIGWLVGWCIGWFSRDVKTLLS